MTHEYRHHPWVRQRHNQLPVRVADQLPEGSAVQRFNARVALGITAAVGSMTCAYLFCVIALTALPSVLKLHSVDADVQWIAQTFLQLVLLSVILVGQNVQARAADKQALATYNDGEANLHEILQAQDHLLAQDVKIEQILAALAAKGA